MWAAVAAAIVVAFCADAALAQRSSTFEEKLEYNYDPARAQDIDAVTLTSPEQCRAKCMGDNRCRYWNWVQLGAAGADPKIHANCTLLRATTGAVRGKEYGFRYVGGAISDQPSTAGGQTPTPTPTPAPASRGNDGSGCAPNVRTTAEGWRYEGMMCAGKLHGHGIFIGDDGLRYEGDWRHGVIEGRGMAHFPNGASYDGQWRNGLPHGQGTYRNPDLGVFTGTWSNGCAIINGQRLWVSASREDCGF